MTQFSVFHPLILSFTSKELYRDVARNWKGIAVGYLLLLMALSCAVTTVKLYLDLSRSVKNDAPALIEQLPIMTIKNGQLQTDPPGQTIIKEKASGRPVVIIDPDNEYRQAELPQNVVLVTKTEFIVNQAGGMSRRVPLSQLGDRTITHESAMEFLKLLTKIFPPIAFLFILVASFVFRLLQALLYGAIGALIAGGAKVTLDYSALVRIAVIAITPVVIFQTLLEIAGINLPFYASWPIAIAIAFWYIFFGIKANADQPAAAFGASSAD